MLLGMIIIKKSWTEVYDFSSDDRIIECEYCENEFKIKVKMTYKP